MDPSPPFPLNKELVRWREALGAREGMPPERVRELEHHLDDVMTEWQAKGLTVEESFWLATRRLGDADALSAQFAQADPAGTWHLRIFWMAIGILVIPLLQFATSALGGGVILLCAKFNVPIPGGVIAVLASVLFIAGLVGLFRGLAAGHWPRLSQAFESFCSRRRNFAWQVLLLAALPLFLVLVGLLAMSWIHLNGEPANAGWRMPLARGPAIFSDIRIIFLTQSVLWPLVLAVLAAKYAPRRRLALPSAEHFSA